jgi:pimeloyl-ACP methyl ester carboxylesterase
MTSAKRVVISLHGIRTRGVWQKELAPELALGGFVPYALDYGPFSALELVRPSSLDKKVKWLVGEYDRIRAATGCERPSVIAHSFGTLQIAHLLRKYSEVIFDKVILAGGIVPVDFPWPDLLDKARVMWVVNEYGGRDWWPHLARFLVPHAGHCGVARFIGSHRALHQLEHAYHGHSDYFFHGHFRYQWLPTLMLNKRAIVDDLHYLMRLLASQYGLRPDSLRCSVLAEQLLARDCLQVVPGLRAGEFLANENELVRMDELGPNAAPAMAFQQAREVRPSAHNIQALKHDLEKQGAIHPRLEWSVALPIPSKRKAGITVGALKIDGLEPAPGLLEMPLLGNDNVTKVLLRLGEALDANRFIEGSTK